MPSGSRICELSPAEVIAVAGGIIIVGGLVGREEAVAPQPRPWQVFGPGPQPWLKFGPGPVPWTPFGG